MVFVARIMYAVDEKCSSANSQGISVAEEKASVSLAYKKTIPESAIAGKIFSVNERSDIIWLITVIDYRVDAEMVV